MSRPYSFYRLADGVFTGSTFAGPEAWLQVNTPQGCAAWPGLVDCTRQRVQGDALVDYQPPAPPADDWKTWTWDPGQWEWLPQPTELAQAAAVRAERNRRLAACDWVVSRAVDRGEPVAAQWSTYRQALRDVCQQPGFPQIVNWPQEP